MAAQDAVQAETETAANAMRTNRLFRILGAGGRIAAAALQAQHDFHGRKSDAINADEKDGNRLHEPSSMAKFLKKATLLRKEIVS